MRRSRLGVGRSLNRPVKKNLVESYLDKATYYLNKARILQEGVAGRPGWDDGSIDPDPFFFNEPGGDILIGHQVSGVSSIEIPEGVRVIGGRNKSKGVFQDLTSLEEVILPDSLEEIGPHTFEGCTKLRKINIPASVTSIGESAFAGCSNLELIEFPEKFDSDCFLADNVFAYCSKLSEISFPEGVASLGAGVFYNCTNLLEVTYPKSLIPPGTTFHGCKNLQTLYIPAILGWQNWFKSFSKNPKEYAALEIPENCDIVSY